MSLTTEARIEENEDSSTLTNRCSGKLTPRMKTLRCQYANGFDCSCKLTIFSANV